MKKKLVLLLALGFLTAGMSAPVLAYAPAPHQAHMAKANYAPRPHQIHPNRHHGMKPVSHCCNRGYVNPFRGINISFNF